MWSPDTKLPANAPSSPDASLADASRVRRRLEELGGWGHLHVRSYGAHILVEPRPTNRVRDRDPIARLTALGHDAFGLAFRRNGGGWDPMVLIDTLDEIVSAMTAVIGAELRTSDAA